MCLLERLVSWDDARVVLETDTHRSPANPLRNDGRLRAVHLCEYGAQATAAHGTLRSMAASVAAAKVPEGALLRPTPGMLVSLRAVEFTRDFIEDLPGSLRVEAACLQANDSSLQYSFRISHEGELLAQGRAVVKLQNVPSMAAD